MSGEFNGQGSLAVRKAGNQRFCIDKEFRNEEIQQSGKFGSQRSSEIRATVLPAATYCASGTKTCAGTFSGKTLRVLSIRVNFIVWQVAISRCGFAGQKMKISNSFFHS